MYYLRSRKGEEGFHDQIGKFIDQTESSDLNIKELEENITNKKTIVGGRM